MDKKKEQKQKKFPTDKYKVTEPFDVGSGKSHRHYKIGSTIYLTKEGAKQFLETNKIK